MIRMFQRQDQEFVVKEITRVDKVSGTGGSPHSGFLARQYVRFWNILPQLHLQPENPHGKGCFEYSISRVTTLFDRRLFPLCSWFFEGLFSSLFTISPSPFASHLSAAV